MKIYIALLCFTMVRLFAADDIFSQNISLHASDTELKSILREIEHKSNYSFFYNNSIIDISQKRSIMVKNKHISEVLLLLLKDTEIEYQIVDDQIVLYPENNPEIRKRLTDLLKKDKRDRLASLSPNTINTLIKASVQNQVSGTVSDESGIPLAGVSVVVRGSKTGTATDFDGKYSLQLPAGENALVFSYMGFETTEVAVSGRAVVHVTLKESRSQLDEVVVIGYGSVKQKNVTGAIAKVESDELNTGVASSFQQTLQGKAAGVQVIQSTGQPGAGVSVQIRSNPSFANAGVLYVIDGVPVNDSAGQPNFDGGVGSKYGSGGVDKSPLNFINPNDIESIQFLKDASSASIYGARAGAGVVLITTKKGKEGRSSLTYSTNYGIQEVDKMYPVFGVREYMRQRNLLREEKWYKDNNIAPYYGTTDPSDADPYTPVYTQDEINSIPADRKAATDAITRSGITQQHNITLSGGNSKTTYFASGNYFDQKGVILNSDYKRYNGRLNLEHTFSDNIKIGANIVMSNSKANNTITGGELENGGIVTAARYWAPSVPLRGEDGSYPLSPYYPTIPNPLSYETVTDLTKSNRLLSSAFGEWNITGELKARANFSYDQSYSKRSSYFPKTFLFGAQANGAASITESDSQSKLYEYTLTYDKVLSEKHHLNAVVGYTYQQTDWGGFNAANQDFISDALSYYYLQSGQSDRPLVGSNKSQTTWASYFGRVIYTYNDNIILQASLRRDGSSIFAENRKWGYFPAVSAGWVISDESWMQAVEPVSFLKLRAGYGETGNSSFEGAAMALYNTDLSAYFGSNSVSSGLVLSRAGNPDLTWETAGEFNVGLDFGLFNNRVSGSVDYFNKTIRDLISFIPYPTGFIISGVYGNAGKTRSAGYEITLESHNIRPATSDGFQWSTNINLSHYLNYWVERSDQALKVLEKYEVEKGRKALFNPFFGYKSDGIFKGEYGTAPDHMPGMLPGGIILKDIHGYDDEGNLIAPDGTITEADRTYIGNQDPDLVFGMGNTFKYKGFDLYIYLSGMKQEKWTPYQSGRATENTMDSFGFNTMPVSAGRWSVQNTNGNFPTSLNDETYSGYQNGADYWLVDASFIRARNITLGYTLPEKLMTGQKLLSSVRVSFDMQNLFTITNYPGLDPELNPNNFYPLVKSYVFGLHATF